MQALSSEKQRLSEAVNQLSDDVHRFRAEKDELVNRLSDFERENCDLKEQLQTLALLQAEQTGSVSILNETLSKERTANQTAQQLAHSQTEIISRMRVEAEVSARSIDELKRNLAELGFLLNIFNSLACPRVRF